MINSHWFQFYWMTAFSPVLLLENYTLIALSNSLQNLIKAPAKSNGQGYLLLITRDGTLNLAYKKRTDNLVDAGMSSVYSPLKPQEVYISHSDHGVVSLVTHPEWLARLNYFYFSRDTTYCDPNLVPWSTYNLWTSCRLSETKTAKRTSSPVNAIFRLSLNIKISDYAVELVEKLFLMKSRILILNSLKKRSRIRLHESRTLQENSTGHSEEFRWRHISIRSWLRIRPYQTNLKMDRTLRVLDASGQMLMEIYDLYR